jgi:aspartate aminotransferase
MPEPPPPAPATDAAPAVARAATQLGTESAFTVLARARELERAGADVLHLELGEPDAPTPPHVVEAGVAAIRAGETGYAPAAGLPELREAAAQDLSASRGVEIDPARVLVANGAKPLLFFTVLAVCEPGDEVVLPDPGFPIYASAVRWAGATPVPLPLRDERGFRVAPEDLAARLTARTKLVILNAPHNPTGGGLATQDAEAIAALLGGARAWVLSDEVYARISYGEPAASVASVPGLLDRTVLLDSLSKTFAMTGWRCGYAAVPGPLVEPLTRFLVNSTSCVPPFVQRAGVAALTGPRDAVDAMVADLRTRRDLVVAGLDALPGVRCRVPSGAFYAFPDVRGTGLQDDELAARLLEEAGVAVLAGRAFGAAGAGHLRLSYATAREDLERALERIEAFLRAGQPSARPSIPDRPASATSSACVPLPPSP